MTSFRIIVSCFSVRAADASRRHKGRLQLTLEIPIGFASTIKVHETRIKILAR